MSNVMFWAKAFILDKLDKLQTIIGKPKYAINIGTSSFLINSYPDEPSVGNPSSV